MYQYESYNHTEKTQAKDMKFMSSWPYDGAGDRTAKEI
jgi:hypothetical protein